MEPEIIDHAAKEIARRWAEGDSADPASTFCETLSRMVAESVSATLRAVEETREELSRIMKLVATASNQLSPDELPTAAGLPAFDASEFATKIDIVKPAVLSLFGTSAVAANVRRQLEQQINRDLFEFLSLYSNRLRRWMEQTLAAMRKTFVAATDIHRAQFEGGQIDVSTDASAIENDLRMLQNWASG
jgi:hypothetical protein